GRAGVGLLRWYHEPPGHRGGGRRTAATERRSAQRGQAPSLYVCEVRSPSERGRSWGRAVANRAQYIGMSGAAVSDREHVLDAASSLAADSPHTQQTEPKPLIVRIGGEPFAVDRLADENRERLADLLHPFVIEGVPGEIPQRLEVREREDGPGW